MDTGSAFITTKICMWESGSKENDMVKGNIFTEEEKGLMENGKQIIKMDKEFYIQQMEPSLLVTLNKIKSMARER